MRYASLGFFLLAILFISFLVSRSSQRRRVWGSWSGSCLIILPGAFPLLVASNDQFISERTVIRAIRN
jgi:hypothetical protein